MVKTWTVLLCLKVKICLTRNYCQLDYLHSNGEFPGCSFGLIQIKAMFLILMLSWPLCAAKFRYASVPIPFTCYVHDFMWLTIDNHLDISIWDVSFIILTYRMKKWGDYKKRDATSTTILQQFYNKSQVVSCYWFKFETNTKIIFLP